MSEGVTLTRELAEIVREMARHYRATGWPAPTSNADIRFYPSDSIIFVNRSGEQIPAYACMQITGTIEEDGRTLLEVDKPDATTIVSENQLLFNGPRDIEDDETGSAQTGIIVKAIKDAAETTDDVGKGWTYTDGQWYLSPGGSMTYYGPSDIDDDVIIVRIDLQSSAYFWAPSGGIPAATTSTTGLTAGAAECYRAIRTAEGVYSKGTATARVENIVPFVVGANGKPIKATRNEYGCYTVDVEDCTTTTTTPTPVVAVPDPIGGGTTIGVDVGLGIGV